MTKVFDCFGLRAWQIWTSGISLPLFMSRDATSHILYTVLFYMTHHCQSSSCKWSIAYLFWHLMRFIFAAIVLSTWLEIMLQDMMTWFFLLSLQSALISIEPYVLNDIIKHTMIVDYFESFWIMMPPFSHIYVTSSPDNSLHTCAFSDLVHRTVHFHGGM